MLVGQRWYSCGTSQCNLTVQYLTVQYLTVQYLVNSTYTNSTNPPAHDDRTLTVPSSNEGQGPRYQHHWYELGALYCKYVTEALAILLFGTVLVQYEYQRWYPYQRWYQRWYIIFGPYIFLRFDVAICCCRNLARFQTLDQTHGRTHGPRRSHSNDDRVIFWRLIKQRYQRW